jgi:hypothetical protein
MNVNELESGTKLDGLIAAAIGFDFNSERCHKCGMRYCQCQEWSPSTDMNDAFQAAEKVGLFEKYCLNKSPTGWDFRITCDEMCPPYLIEDAPSAAVAICRAILKLKS